MHDIADSLSLSQASVDRIPLFEETCRLLYAHSPQELLTFVTFAQLARDHQADGDSAFARKSRNDFFCHRAVNALPMFISKEATPTSPEAIRVYCHLLLNRYKLEVLCTLRGIGFVLLHM